MLLPEMILNEAINILGSLDGFGEFRVSVTTVLGGDTFLDIIVPV